MCLLLSATILTVLSSLILTPSQAENNVCDTCSCAPYQGTVKHISCACNTLSKEFNITQQAMGGLAHIESFSIANCSSVNFHKNSFAESHDLAFVSVSHVDLVTLPVGVFSTLHSLLLEDVGDLRFLSKAFIGADNINNITIHRSNIRVLPAHSLYNMHGLISVELKDVRIGVIKAHAIDIKMAPYTTFIIDSCEIEYIETSAITLDTGSLIITDSNFQNVTANAVYVTAKERVTIGTTFFGAGCSDAGVLVESNDIRIMNNTFHTLPIGLLEPPSNGETSIIFQQNIIYEFTLGSLNEMINLSNFSMNEVICDCVLASAIPTFVALNKINTDHIIDGNYCHLESKCKINLQEFSKNQLCYEHPIVDEEALDNLCTNQPSTTTEYHKTAAVTQRPTTGASTSQPPTHAQSIIDNPTSVFAERTASGGKFFAVNGMLLAFILLTALVKHI